MLVARVWRRHVGPFVYQPIVDLCSGTVVGYEALARGAVGGPFERPDLLFAAAHEQGLTAELDWACRAAAFEGALAAGLRTPSTLFVNVEPDAIDRPPRRISWALWLERGEDSTQSLR